MTSDIEKIKSTAVILDRMGPLKEESSVHSKGIAPGDKLKFAREILFALGFLFLAGMTAKVFYEDTEVFDACKTVLPPIVTLIIGYYFGESKN